MGIPSLPVTLTPRSSQYYFQFNPENDIIKEIKITTWQNIMIGVQVNHVKWAAMNDGPPVICD